MRPQAGERHRRRPGQPGGQLKRLEFALKKGDIVVMLTEDLQTYYLICKVVAL